MREKADSWWHGVSPSSRQDRLDSALTALKALEDAGLTAASVLANLHHRWIIPLMERRLHIFEMHEEADLVALAESRLLPDLFPQEYAAMRTRRAVNLKAMWTDDAALWKFVMLPHGPLVSGFPSLFGPSIRGASFDPEFYSLSAGDGRERRAVRPAHAPSPSARTCSAAAGAGASGEQEREEDPATRALGTVRREFLAARAAGTFLPGDFGVLVVGQGGGERCGTSSPREVGAFASLAQSRGGGGRDSAWSGRRGARRQAVNDRCGAGRRCADARHGGTCARWRRLGARWLLLPDVRNCPSRGRVFEWRGSNLLVFVLAG
jgi:hypothetical protein